VTAISDEIRKLGVITSPADSSMVSLVIRLAKLTGFNVEPLEIEHLSSLSDVDALVIIGTDRVLLDALQVLGEKIKPILGISPPEYVSFLMPVSFNEIDRCLSALAKKQYKIVKYTRIKGKVDQKEVVYALNEIAIFSSKSAILIEYELLINGEHVWRDRSDGIIVATPVGSTAYAFSAGGPIIMENTPVLEIVPVNSLDPLKKPLVIKDTSKIVIRDISSRHPCEIIADGCKRVKVKKKVEITKAKTPVPVIKITATSITKESLEKKYALIKEIQEIPPSAKYILKVLEAEGPLSVKEIAEKTLLSPRTVRYSLALLIKRGLVKKLVDLRDTRQTYYEAVTSPWKNEVKSIREKLEHFKLNSR